MSDTEWYPWKVAPDSGFEVADPSRLVAMRQVSDTEFEVLTAFRYSNGAVEKYLLDRLVADGMSPVDAGRAVEAARTFSPADVKKTDLASIPRFLRWFENSYGRHTLAALLHDELIISGSVNTGSLRSDTLSDRFFREMMRTSEVPWLRRWLMWSAVAMRTRFMAGGYRRWSVVLWLLLSVLGISFAVLGVAALTGDDTSTSAVTWLVLAVVLIFVGAPLWGRQWGASLVAAVVAIWLVPAALVAGGAYVAYWVSERVVAMVYRGR